jgi:hypothetical protein
MLFTLIILKDFHFSVVEYLKLILDHNMVKKPLIPRILFSLYLLTYYDNGSTSQRDIDFKALYNKGEKRKNDVMNIINNDLRFESELNTFSQDIIFKQKRAWCSLRDFFKSPEFSNYFFSSLKNHGFDRNSVLKQSGLLRQFELPGDVWNNNSTFRNCILTGTSYNKKSNEPFNRLLRNIYVEKNILVGYPEQFDITFDFVSRMCEDNNCDICPYGKDINKGDKLNKICHKDTSKYCSVVLACCGYRYHCNPINCELVKLKYV